MIGEKVKQGAVRVMQRTDDPAADFDWASALATVPLLQKLLGV